MRELHESRFLRKANRSLNRITVLTTCDRSSMTSPLRNSALPATRSMKMQNKNYRMDFSYRLWLISQAKHLRSVLNSVFALSREQLFDQRSAPADEK